MRAAIYARYSTENQREASIDDQFRECGLTAAANKLDVVARFEDQGISGGTADRPGYQAMLSAARDLAFDVIVVEDVSRLWRARGEYGVRSAELEDLGVHLVTCVGDDTRRDGWGLMLTIKAAMAEHARRETSYRTRRSMHGLALAGKPTGGRVYGFSGGQIEPEQAAVVVRIFSLYADGSSGQKVADQLNYESIPAPNGGKWRQSTVAAIISSGRYAGRVQWGKSTYRGTASNSRLRRRLERPEGALVDRQDEALRIVPAALIEKCDAIRNGRV